MRSFRKWAIPTLLCIASSAAAVDIVLPQNAELVDTEARKGSISLPIGTYGLIAKPASSASGDILRQAWVIVGSDNASGLMEQLIVQYQRQDFEPVWQCETASCGGFDFRYNIETSPPPAFDVDLKDFYYADLRNGEDIITLLASSVNGNIHLQQIYIQSANSEETFSFEYENPSIQNQSSTARLILTSIEFEVGSSTPSRFDAGELQSLADRLTANPEETIYIVGHTDQSGSLSANVAISKQRAQAVRQLLITDFGVASNRILAEGVGFLAPIADNASEAGRNQNRRVEAVFLVN